jgi:hypothetical protein
VKRSISTSSRRSAARSSWRRKIRPDSLPLAAVLALPIAFLSAAPPTPGASADLLDGGTFTLYLEGTRIGEEQFVIHEERADTTGSVYAAGAELDLKLDGRTMRIRVALETLGSCCRPRRYEAEINGSEATRIVGTLVRERVRLDVRSPQGDEMKEFLVRGKTAILERHVAHHYFFAARLLGSDPVTEASIIVPRDRNQHAVTIVDQGEESVRIDERELQLRHITITADSGTAHHVWLDGHRVMRVEVPDDQFVAVRSDNADASVQQ